MARAPLLNVADLRKLGTFARDAVRLQVGPMALVQRPPDAQPRNLLALAAVTVPKKPNVATQALALLLGMSDLLVVPVGATSSEGTLCFGRNPECDVLLQHPSTSARHAALRWDSWRPAAWILDLGSTNGTWINGTAVKGEVQLAEGDTVSLGDEGFLFVLTDTLHALLRAGRRG